MRGEREEVHAELSHVDQDFSNRLDGVRMDDGARLPGSRGECGKGVEDRPRLVVREKGGHERRPLVERRRTAGLRHPVRVHGKLDGLEPFLPEGERRFPNGRVLGRGEGHAGTPGIGLPGREGGSAHGEVVGLGASRREHDFRRLRAEGPRDLDPRRLHCLPGRAAGPVGGGGIRGSPLQPGPHALENFRVERRRGVVVRVDAAGGDVQEKGPPDG